MIEDNLSEEEASSVAMDDPPDQSAMAGESEFVEVDQTGRYGRYNEVLGKGAFKTVYRAFDEEDGIEVAWNQVKIEDLLQSPEDLERLYSEVHLLKSLKHKNIIKFYHSWVDTKKGNVNFITEIFTSGTLRQYRKRHKHVDIKAVKNWARQILRGLLYLHSHDPPIIHRDVKCDNIFVNGNSGEVKIGDLGLATILRQAHAAHSVIGTPEFMAPELYEEEYNELVDIYSFGMCLLEMVTFEYPYSECTNAAQIYKKVTTGKRPAALERVKDAEVRQFIEKCLAAASRRLPARELLKDPFLQSDSGRDYLESLPLLPIVKPVGDDMDDLIGKESRSEYPSSNLSERHGSNLGPSVGRTEPSFSISNKGSDLTYAQVLPSPKDDHLTGSRDFRVKGKKRDDNTVFLRLRIVDAQGHVSNIHFLFDIEGDTALSVASEMVAELDLSDQDVTNIADMIDQEILGLLPQWKPGASFDDSADPEEWVDQVEQPLLDNSSEGARANLVSDTELGDEAVMREHDSGNVPSNWKTQSPTFRRRREGIMQSRIEEVTYGLGGSDCSPCSSDAHIMSTDSSEHHHGRAHTYHADDLISAASDYTRKGTESMETPHLNVLNALDGTKKLPIECDQHDSKSFNDLVESQRNADNSMYTHETWKEIMNRTSGFEDCEKGHARALWPECTLTGGAVHDDMEWDDELKLLALRQEQELSDLRRKHEQAVLEVKNKWEKKSGSSLSCHLPSLEAPSRSAIADVSGSKVPDKAANVVAEQVTSLPSALKQEDGESSEADFKSEAKCFGVAKGSLLKAQDCTTHAQTVVVNQSSCGVDDMTNREVCSGSELSCSVSGMETPVTSENATCGSSSNPGISTSDVSGISTIAVGQVTTRCDPHPNRMERVESALRGKRDSYVDLYKTSGLEREKFGAAKIDSRANEAAAQEGLSKPFSSKVDLVSDSKKEQLQKSIAELEAKTLEGLHRSRNGYLSSNSSKKPLAASSAQLLFTASQTRPNDLKKG